MIVIDFFVNLVSLNLQWFVELGMNNLIWVFVFLTAAFVYNEMHWSPKYFFVSVFYILTLVEFVPMLGWVYLVGGFFFLNYVSRITIMTFAGQISWLKDSFPAIMAVQFWLVLIYYNLFLV
ncbi:MAG: hypothetical protein ABH986_01200 [archaeon]